MEYVFNQLLGNHVVQSKPSRKVSGSALQLLVCLIKSVAGNTSFLLLSTKYPVSIKFLMQVNGIL